MRAVVTGGAGFIGSRLVERLVNRGWIVTVIDNFSTGEWSNLEGLDCVVYDTCITSRELPLVKHDILFHLAAPVSVIESHENPEKYAREIVDGTINITKWSLEMGATRMLLASTAAVYGESEDLPFGEMREQNCMNPYAKSKWTAERVLHHMSFSNSITSTALRFFNVFGEGQRRNGGYLSVLPIFREQWESGKPLTINGDGEQTRDFIWVEDVVTAMMVAAINTDKKYRLYNVGSGEETSVNQIAEAFSGEVKYLPEIDEPKRSLACISKISEELNWKPTLSVENWIETIR